jgi:hypothetical protein
VDFGIEVFTNLTAAGWLRIPLQTGGAGMIAVSPDSPFAAKLPVRLQRRRHQLGRAGRRIPRVVPPLEELLSQAGRSKAEQDRIGRTGRPVSLLHGFTFGDKLGQSARRLGA